MPVINESAAAESVFSSLESSLSILRGAISGAESVNCRLQGSRPSEVGLDQKYPESLQEFASEIGRELVRLRKELDITNNILGTSSPQPKAMSGAGGQQVRSSRGDF